MDGINMTTGVLNSCGMNVIIPYLIEQLGKIANGASDLKSEKVKPEYEALNEIFNKHYGQDLNLIQFHDFLKTQSYVAQQFILDPVLRQYMLKNFSKDKVRLEDSSGKVSYVEDKAEHGVPYVNLPTQQQLIDNPQGFQQGRCRYPMMPENDLLKDLFRPLGFDLKITDIEAGKYNERDLSGYKAPDGFDPISTIEIFGDNDNKHYDLFDVRQEPLDPRWTEELQKDDPYAQLIRTISEAQGSVDGADVANQQIQEILNSHLKQQVQKDIQEYLTKASLRAAQSTVDLLRETADRRKKAPTSAAVPPGSPSISQAPLASPSGGRNGALLSPKVAQQSSVPTPFTLQNASPLTGGSGTLNAPKPKLHAAAPSGSTSSVRSPLPGTKGASADSRPSRANTADLKQLYQAFRKAVLDMGIIQYQPSPPEGFEELDEKLTKVTKEIEELKQRSTYLDEDLEQLEKTRKGIYDRIFEKLNKELTGVTNEIKELTQRPIYLDDDLEQLEQKRKEIYDKIAVFDSKYAYNEQVKEIEKAQAPTPFPTKPKGP